MAMFYNIPHELQTINQWIVWRYETRDEKKPTKVPYCPRGGHLASVTDAASWATFAECVRAVEHGYYSGIGFVFTDADEFAFVDLDFPQGENAAQMIAMQTEIYEEFNSYSEISPSGKGLHIISKGRVPEGRKRDCIEIYSSLRYATMTGNVFGGRNRINHRQHCLTALYDRMTADAGKAGKNIGTNFVFQGTEHLLHTDEQIVNIAMSAKNGDKFTQLMQGDQTGYKSHSHADQALINIIAFYTQNKDQIKRIFAMSGLANRPKAKRQGYLDITIATAFDQQLPPVVIEMARREFDAALAEARGGKEPVAATTLAEPPEIAAGDASEGPGEASEEVARARYFATLPRGLIRDIAASIYARSPTPVAEISLVGALGLMAGMCGRAYNISGTGLNLYLLAIAETGCGKEALSAGVNMLRNSIKNVPGSEKFAGPVTISSEPALLKHLATWQVFCSVVGEFGQKLKQLTDPRANSTEIGLKKVLLDLFNKSGYADVMGSGIYSNRKENIPSIASPAFSLIGECEPVKFYELLNESMVTEGLLPRFLIVEYRGQLPRYNKGHELIVPSAELVDKIAELASHVLSLMMRNTTVHVGLTAEADGRFDAFNNKIYNYMTAKTNSNVTKHLWNRAHVKALKIAALFAIGQNIAAPVIDDETAKWCISFVSNETALLAKRFDNNEVGSISDESKQVQKLTAFVKEFFLYPKDKIIKAYRIDERLYNDKIIPAAYLSRRALPNATFKFDRLGATSALKRSIAILEDSGKLIEITKPEMAKKYNTVQKAYVVGDPSLLSD